MSSELSTPQPPSTRALLRKITSCPVVNAVTDGNIPWRDFVNNPADPQSDFLLTIARFSSLTGLPPNEVIYQELKEWLQDGNETDWACSSIFVGGGADEGNIFTTGNYKRQVVATRTASDFIIECQKRGFPQIWGCWWNIELFVSRA